MQTMVNADIMRHIKQWKLDLILLATASILWCEIGYHYFVFYRHCSGWPEPSSSENQKDFVRMFVLTDTHIMGPTKSFRLDKLRREWLMKQAFSISNSIYKPDIVIFLGDIFDEGYYSPDEAFYNACDDFDRVFPFDPAKQQRIIIPGNHDIGFHHHMIYRPYVLERFHEKYQAPLSIELIRSSRLKHVNIVATNSMTFYNDSCMFCSYGAVSTNRIARDLDSLLDKGRELYSPPILLTHIPLYRMDDSQCDYRHSMANKVKKDNIEGEDVLHSSSSMFLLEKLKPMLVLSGHTHMQCLTTHQIPGKPNKSIDELTISSYNHKYAEKRPGFLLLSANSTHVFTKHCNLIEEYVVLIIYTTTIVIICTRFLVAFGTRRPQQISS